MKLSELFTMDTGKDLIYKTLIPGEYIVMGQGENNFGITATTKYLNTHHLYKAYSGIVVASYGTLYASVPCRDFYIGTRVKVLLPKQELSVNVKLYYALCINQYKNIFSYGRVGGQRILELDVPSLDEIPSWVYEMEIPTFDDIAESKTQQKVELPPITEWMEFSYPDIFNLTKGRGPSATEAKHNPGTIPYIGASAENNGITHYSSHNPEHQGNVITIATDGSVGEAFYQPNAFNATSNIAVLTIKNHNLTPSLAMFLITLIRQEQYKFNYGRKWGLTRMKESTIRLPIKEDGTPNWQLMEDYINSLPYSKYL